MREFAAGFATLARGFGFWGRTPRAMLLGLVPAALVAFVAVAALIALAMTLPQLTDTLTPFADGWLPFWAGAVRVALGAALFGAGLLLVAVTFTAVTLAVGEPFYDRVWRAVETATTGSVPEATYGFWRAVGDSARLIGRGMLAAVVAGLVGLVPIVGGIVGFATGVVLTGWLLADELSARALSARGLDESARRMLRRSSRARALGFGVATQLCFLVPLGAVAVMPAAVAGSTLLAHDLMARGARGAGSVSVSAPAPSPRERG
jgi:CysZ protein